MDDSSRELHYGNWNKIVPAHDSRRVDWLRHRECLDASYPDDNSDRAMDDFAQEVFHDWIHEAYDNSNNFHVPVGDPTKTVRVFQYGTCSIAHLQNSQ